MIDISQFKLIASRNSAKLLNEAQTRIAMIDPMLEYLNWDIRDTDTVQIEYKLEDKKSVDYVLFQKAKLPPTILIEAKANTESISHLAYIAQAVNYGNTLNVPWCILTNGHEWALYCVHAPEFPKDKIIKRINLLTSSDDDIAKFMSLIDNKSFSDDALRAEWDKKSSPQKTTGAEEYTNRHPRVATDYREAVINFEIISGSNLTKIKYNRMQNVFADGAGNVIHFCFSSLYRKSDGEFFIKLPKSKLSDHTFVIGIPCAGIGFRIPCETLSSFFNNIPINSKKRAKCWDPRIALDNNRWIIWTNKEKFGGLDITEYFFEFQYRLPRENDITDNPK